MFKGLFYFVSSYQIFIMYKVSVRFYRDIDKQVTWLFLDICFWEMKIVYEIVDVVFIYKGF